jgi:hypothetical protein
VRCCDLRYIPPRQGAIDHFTGMVALHRKIARYLRPRLRGLAPGRSWRLGSVVEIRL